MKAASVLKNMAKGSRRTQAELQDDRRRTNLTPRVADAAAQAALALQVPFVGMSMRWWGLSDPSPSFMIEDGRLLEIAAYPDAFAVFGRRFSKPGDPSDTFRLPDSRGRTGVGAGAPFGSVLTARQVGDTYGSEEHTLTSAQAPSHTHTGSTSSDSHSHTGTTNQEGNHAHSYVKHAELAQNLQAGGNADNFHQGTGSEETGGAGSHSHTLTTSSDSHSHTFTTGSAGSGGAHPNEQPSISVNYVVRVSY